VRAYKEKQYLVFEFDDGKTVKYDLATGQTIGKLGKPVKSISTQLRGYMIPQVIDMFEDEKYRRYLKFVNEMVNYNARRRSYVNKVTNVGSFLLKVNDWSRFEQFFACGIREIDHRLKRSITSVPNGLIKLCVKHNIYLSDTLIDKYNETPDLYHNLLGQDYTTLNKSDIVMILGGPEYYNNSPTRRMFSLVNIHKYNPKSLFKYIDNLMTYEALNDISAIINELYDYVVMVSAISLKYEKYPKNFLTTHRIATRNYNRLKVTFEENSFCSMRDKSLECTIDRWKFIYPETTQDIKDEAVQQNNCVASYIQRVINGECHILFMREKEFPDKSVVTLEIVDGKVVQARGKFNREVTREEREIIDRYNKRLERMKAA